MTNKLGNNLGIKIGDKFRCRKVSYGYTYITPEVGDLYTAHFNTKLDAKYIWLKNSKSGHITDFILDDFTRIGKKLKRELYYDPKDMGWGK